MEGTEFGVARAGLIKAHLIDQLLEYERIVGKQINPPLPIVEADGARNDLIYLPGVAPPDHSMVVHQTLSLFERQHVPVVNTCSPLVHRVEAYVATFRNLRP